MKLSFHSTGYLVSGLLHLLAVTVIVAHLDPVSDEGDVDTSLTLSLSMFKEALAVEEMPQPVPETPPETQLESKPENTQATETKQTHPTARVPEYKQFAPLELPVEQSVNVEPDVTHSDNTESQSAPSASAQSETVLRQPVLAGSEYQRLKQQYIKKLLKRIHRNKSYPRNARLNREEGRVLISFIIEKSGEISGLKLIRSSGYANLDKAAIRTLERVSPAQPLPDALGMTSWALAVPIAFDLRN
ncbi:MAG: energy transducer TonB [Thioalkalispiraceae bacterium]